MYMAQQMYIRNVYGATNAHTLRHVYGNVHGNVHA